MDRAISGRGTPISLQSMFAVPFAHFDSPTFPDGGAMVPIHITSMTTSNSNHQRLKPRSIWIFVDLGYENIEAVFYFDQRMS